MKLGTAQITVRPASCLVVYVNTGSFLRGEQTFATEQQAREFCANRRLRVL